MSRQSFAVLLVIAACPALGSDPNVGQATDTLPTRPAVVLTALERETEQIAMLDERDIAVWLGEGDARFLAVKRSSVLPAAQGTMVLVRNRAVGADADDRIGYLRKELPRLGWNTLTLDLPDPRDVAVPARDRDRSAPIGPGARYGRGAEGGDAPAAKAEAAPTPKPSDDIDRASVLARLGAAVAEATRDGSSVIMVGEGEAAVWVARANGASPLARATIVLNIDDPEARLDGQPTSHWLQALTVPALLMQEAPRSWSPDARLPDDTELLLLPPTHPAGEERLVRQVRGWLKRRSLA